jgi:pSer/pThr/pTyr-binding forkhead associated (FHA) protein
MRFISHFQRTRPALFNISLLQTNGNGKGTRHRVTKSPYVIGRHESCDLTLPSRTVSRQHCTVVFDDSSVILRDLESRNGTEVEGAALNPEQPVPIAHHSMVQVGEYSFRVSVRDAKTKKPYVPAEVDLSTVSGALVSPQHKGTDKLLSELDELASRLDLFDNGAENPETRTRELTPEEARSARKEAKDKQAQEKQAEDKQHSSVSPQRNEAEGDQAEPVAQAKNTAPKESLEESSVTEEEPAEDAEESAGWGTGWLKKKKGPEPGKLPKHLRQQGPNDSTEAADQALKSFLKK